MTISGLNFGISSNNIQTKRFESFVARGMDNVNFYNGVASRFLNDKSNVNQAAGVFGLASNFSLESAFVCQNLLSDINSEINQLNLQMDMMNPTASIYNNSEGQDVKAGKKKSKSNNQWQRRFLGCRNKIGADPFNKTNNNSNKNVNDTNKKISTENKDVKMDNAIKSKESQEQLLNSIMQEDEVKKLNDELQQEKKNAEEYNSDADIQFKTLKIAADNNELMAKNKFYHCNNSKNNEISSSFAKATGNQGFNLANSSSTINNDGEKNLFLNLN